MRHKYKGRKLGTDYSHTKAMKRSLVSALFLNDRIKTIESRAKEIRPDVDKIITWAKKGDLHSRRLAISALGNDSELVREIFDKVSQGMFEDRQGGYTRIVKLGPRKGDNAPMVIMELITEALPTKKKAQTSSKSKAHKVTSDKQSNESADAKDKKTLTEAEESKESKEPDVSEDLNAKSNDGGGEKKDDNKNEDSKDAQEDEVAQTSKEVSKDENKEDNDATDVADEPKDIKVSSENSKEKEEVKEKAEHKKDTDSEEKKEEEK